MRICSETNKRSYGLFSVPVNTRNKWHSEHLQLWSKIQDIVGHDAIEVTVDPGDTLHGAGTAHVGFQRGVLVVVVS